MVRQSSYEPYTYKWNQLVFVCIASFWLVHGASWKYTLKAILIFRYVVYVRCICTSFAIVLHSIIIFPLHVYTKWNIFLFVWNHMDVSRILRSGTHPFQIKCAEIESSRTSKFCKVCRHRPAVPSMQMHILLYRSY